MLPPPMYIIPAIFLPHETSNTDETFAHEYYFLRCICEESFVNSNILLCAYATNL